MENGNLRIGITDFARTPSATWCSWRCPRWGRPSAGRRLWRGRVHQEREWIYAPVAGTIVARNDAVETAPETLNTDPYEGWLAVRSGAGGSSVRRIPCR